MPAARAEGGWLRRAARRLRAAWSRGRPAAPGPYDYQPRVGGLTYEDAVARLETRGLRVVRSAVDVASPPVVDAVASGLAHVGVPVEELAIDVSAFGRYRDRAQYASRYPEYYGSRMAEKQLEHFVTLELLGLSAADVFVDIASEDSPVPDIYQRLTGATTYWQDIQYPPGVHGRRIGGDACGLPLADGFASAVALTCSLEHFERDADQRLCGELARVLRPGGRLAIAPLYLFPQHVVQTDPVYSAQADVPFDAGATVYAARDWRNRHGRFYSPQSLRERVLERLAPAFDFTVRRITGWEAIGEPTYLRFALWCRRREGATAR